MKNAVFAALAALGLAAACGKVGPPQPPIIRIPEKVGDLAVRQEGDSVVLSWTNPSTYVDANPAADLSMVRVLRDGIKVGEIAASGPGRPQSYSVNVADKIGVASRFEVVVDASRGKPSAISNPVTIQPEAFPGTPRGLRFKVDQYRIFLDWEPPETNPSLADVYTVQRSDQPAVSSVSSPHFEDAKFELGKTYTYTVRAARGADARTPGLPGESISVPATDTTPPQTPTGLQIQATPPGVFLRWDKAAERDFAGVRIYRDGVEVGFVSGDGFQDLDYVKGSSYQLSAEDIFKNPSQRTPSQPGP